MSLEAWGDEGDVGPDGYVTEEIAEEMFVKGAQMMREMLARFVENDGYDIVAMSMRSNWHPNWGEDPGKPDEIVEDVWA